MSKLPSLRTEKMKQPFKSTDINLFGPMLIKLRTARIKRRGILFTCLAARAVYIEAVEGLNTECFINALLRFRSSTRKDQQVCSKGKHRLEFQPITIAENGWFMGENYKNCEGSDVQISYEHGSHGLLTSNNLHKN